jgi:hypothetical protein
MNLAKLGREIRLPKIKRRMIKWNSMHIEFKSCSMT